MMRRNTYLITVIGTLLLGLAFISCEDFDDETFELSAIDAAAIASIEDTLEIKLAMKSANILNDGSQIGIIVVGGGIGDTIIMPIDTATNVLEAVEIQTALVDAGIDPIGVNDTVYAVTIRSDSLCYQLFEASTGGDYVFYVAHFAALNIYGSTGEMVEMKTDEMSPELIAGLYELPGPVPTIKGRYEYTLSAGTYLFAIARLESTTSDNFRIAIRRD